MTNALNFVTYNQDFTCLAVGTSSGYRIYNCDPFQKVYEHKEGDVSIIEMLFSTSLVALIFSPRRLVITNTKRQTTICELTFPTSILAVKLNRKRLIVVLEEQIYVYDISNMKLLHTIETSPNPNAICALSPSSDRCYIAYPRPTSSSPSPFSPPSHAPPAAGTPAPLTGDVLLFDALKLEAVNVIEAHKSPLSCVALNADGTLLATSSDKGTIIRVFSVPQSQKLYQFRRGTYPSRIFSMSFNMASSLLCISSATETVHIFKLSSSYAPVENTATGRAGSESPTGSLSSSPSTHAGPAGAGFEQYEATSKAGAAAAAAKARPAAGNGGMGALIRRSSQSIGRTLAGAAGGYLPNAVTEMWEPARDFAFVKLKKPGVRSVVALSPSSPQIMVVTAEGDFYVYNVDMERGGECVLVKQYSLVFP
ncbi:Similar to Autophagy-related protein 18; acc. no. Q0CW30 [Pyronema omphalodes CBS 100304]|uniref:Autophagy-related protein 18 n=1 Tax=Pyronema omphalodes (strain CBS 100304) TaxID=1076935 RepID=U4LSV9_PYROM|nr:Similar to Autophagy-related protein 18; acc. no. Q0CW30 [Pyronema omphalodes CBS 100304]